MLSRNSANRHATQDGASYALHYGNARKPLATVIPDSIFSGMWRIRWPDGRLSDMANLSRAKDAAFELVQRGLSNRNGSNTLHWRITTDADGRRSPLARLNGGPGPDSGGAE